MKKNNFFVLIKANKFGFKPIIIDPLSHPLLCSQINKLITLPIISSQMSLYSIDCVRKIFQIYHYQQTNVYQLLDRARLAETSGDITFWDKSYEVKQSKFKKQRSLSIRNSLDFTNRTIKFQ